LSRCDSARLFHKHHLPSTTVALQATVPEHMVWHSPPLSRPHGSLILCAYGYIHDSCLFLHFSPLALLTPFTIWRTQRLRTGVAAPPRLAHSVLCHFGRRTRLVRFRHNYYQLYHRPTSYTLPVLWVRLFSPPTRLRTVRERDVPVLGFVAARSSIFLPPLFAWLVAFAVPTSTWPSSFNMNSLVIERAGLPTVDTGRTPLRVGRRQPSPR